MLMAYGRSTLLEKLSPQSYKKRWNVQSYEKNIKIKTGSRTSLQPELSPSWSYSQFHGSFCRHSTQKSNFDCIQANQIKGNWQESLQMVCLKLLNFEKNSYPYGTLMNEELKSIE